ncbi:MAG TPA: DUF1990 family protein [Microbacteriaceae bacterium]|nr:DUF1990 family protein [Microbacteriaceae bacterium]
MPEEQARRSTHVDLEASYAAIGASQAVDLMKFPPTDSTPFEFEHRLGSGNKRFMLSSALLMTWGAQTGTGMKVDVVDIEQTEHYRGADLSDTEQPVFNSGKEESFAPDGTPYLRVGAVVKLAEESGFEREMRVLTVVDEENLVGFVMGSTVLQEVTGEEFFRVEHRADDTVWGVVRGFYHAGDSGIFGLRSKKRLKQMVSHIEKQIEALAPAVAASTIINNHEDL